MTTTIEIKLQKDLFDFVESYAKELNRKREEVIAEALKLLRADWELEKGSSRHFLAEAGILIIP